MSEPQLITPGKVCWRPYFTLSRGGSLKDPDTGAYIPYTPPEGFKPYEATPRKVRPPRPYRVSPMAKKYTHGALTWTANEWAKRLGISVDRFKERLRENPETAFTKGHLPRAGRPKNVNPKTCTHGGMTLTYREWAEHLGISYNLFKDRFNRNPDTAFVKGARPPGRPKKAKLSPEQLSAPPGGDQKLSRPHPDTGRPPSQTIWYKNATP